MVVGCSATVTVCAEEGKGSNILLGHFGIQGAEVGSNYVMTSSDLISLRDIPVGDFDQVFLGHFHKPQKLAENVRFVGATHQHNWGDTGQERGVWIWETGIDGHGPRFIPITAPKFITVSSTSLDTLAKDIPGNIIRIASQNPIVGTEWDGIKRQLLDHGARWVELQLLPREQPEVTESDFSPTMDFEEMVDLYVDDLDPDQDHDALKQLGRSFIRSCQ